MNFIQKVAGTVRNVLQGSAVEERPHPAAEPDLTGNLAKVEREDAQKPNRSGWRTFAPVDPKLEEKKQETRRQLMQVDWPYKGFSSLGPTTQMRKAVVERAGPNLVTKAERQIILDCDTEWTRLSQLAAALTPDCAERAYWQRMHGSIKAVQTGDAPPIPESILPGPTLSEMRAAYSEKLSRLAEAQRLAKAPCISTHRQIIERLFAASEGFRLELETEERERAQRWGLPFTPVLALVGMATLSHTLRKPGVSMELASGSPKSILAALGIEL